MLVALFAETPALQDPCMQEPAACGALLAQQASVHSGPLAAAGHTMLPATSISNSAAARVALATIVALLKNSLRSLD